ncbi:RNA polymerase sigma factor SigM [Gordonia sp. NB41Y]|uniref:RNA polymerase sigma factor SigM n=1 Tax=Gordonia sp. NB41Y TaxID=875808 RepID=UPI0002BDCA33|nr:RNA polymerase sigma factor SigM [Gordonia sp. NB41Y]EMP14604.1 RNA polymerase sigma factor SigM [Gordonia sp. NB41Y]WLP88511.1 RNA polymerase sigma factor SigM [Gordonia sp. NB41Y]
MSGGTTHDQRTDEQLLRAHIHGDPTAFTILITRHQSYLWTVANRTTGNPDDAADALQEALLSAHRTAHTFRADAKVTSWLHRIVVNAALDRLRRNASRRTLPLPEFDTLALSDDADEFGRVDLAVSIDQALDELPPDQRAAVVAIDLEGYTVAEAAERLGVPHGTIKSRCSRGRVKLANLLRHLQTGDP